MNTGDHGWGLEVAQAGGGGDFGGFDSGSSSSSSDFSSADSFSGGDSSIGYETGGTDSTLGEALGFAGGLIGFMVLFVVVIGLLIHFTGDTTPPPPSPKRPAPRPPQDPAARQQALAGIAAGDPAFDQEGFLHRAAAAFVTTQYAWSEQDLRPCRAFLSDGVHERFGLLIAMQQAEGIRNRMKDVAVTACAIVEAGQDPKFDTIHVAFTASAISYKESLTSGQRVGGNSATTPISFSEVWSFSRRPGVPTRLDSSVLEGSCPSCGSGLDIVDRAKCRSCEQVVVAGAHDWVLAEITQASEWGQRALPPLPGMAVLHAADPGLSAQHLEDRASVIFWRAMSAVYRHDLGVLAPLMPAGAPLPPLWDPTPGEYWHTPAVGAVEVVAVTPAEVSSAGEPARDTVEVLVRWSAHRASGKGSSPVFHDQKTIYSHVLVLQRNAGVTSDITHAFASTGCRTCGAPLDVGTTTACPSCATAVNDGSTAWILTRVNRYSPPPLDNTATTG